MPIDWMLYRNWVAAFNMRYFNWSNWKSIDYVFVCDFWLLSHNISSSVVFGCLGNKHTMPKCILNVRMNFTLDEYPHYFGRSKLNIRWNTLHNALNSCTSIQLANMTNYDETNWNYIRYELWTFFSFVLLFAVVATLDENTNTHLKLNKHTQVQWNPKKRTESKRKNTTFI